MPLHFALYLAVAGAVALIVQLFALAEADLYFGKALFVDEHAERHYGEAFFLSLHVPLVQLFSLQQQFAVVYGQVAGVAGIYILGYVQAFEPQLAVIKKTIAIIKTHLAIAHRFNLRTRKHYASLEPVFDGILIGGRAVLYINVLRQGSGS